MADFSIKQIKAFLSEHGIPVENLDSTAEELCSRHNTTLDAIKEERDNYKKDADTLASVKQELESLKAAQGDNKYKDLYEQEHKAFEDYKSEVEERELIRARQSAFVEVLKDAGITNEKSIAKILKYTDLSTDDYELDDSGKFKNAKAVLKSVKEEWPEHITVEHTGGADTKHPPENNGGSDFDKMSLADKMTYANEHPNDEAVKAWLSK